VFWASDGSFSRTYFTLAKGKLDQCPSNDLQFIKENSLQLFGAAVATPVTTQPPCKAKCSDSDSLFLPGLPHQERLKGVAWDWDRDCDLR